MIWRGLIWTNTYGIEFGGGNVDENPCTRNGFTGSENGKGHTRMELKKRWSRI